MSNTMSDERAIARLRGLAASVLPDGDQAAWEAINYLAARLAHNPAAAVPGMAAFDKAVSDFNSWAIVYGRQSTDANLRALAEAREAVKTLHAQALESRVHVPEVTDDDALAFMRAFNIAHGGTVLFGASEIILIKQSLESYRARLLAEQGAK